MAERKLKKEEVNLMNRRQFCGSIPLAILGCLHCDLHSGSLRDFPDYKKMPTNSNPKELKMKKKIKAVIAEVISQKGSCALNHKVGDRVTFTESGVEGKICIHALYSMMPGVFAMMYEADFSWLKDPDKKTHACPDAFNPVVFEIRRIRA